MATKTKKTTTEKNAEKMSIDAFLPKYIEAVNSDMTKEEFANSIGLAAASVYQRITKLRKELKDLGEDPERIPHLKGEGRAPVSEKALDILNKMGK